MKHISSLRHLLVAISLWLVGCATTYESACHELADRNSSEIRRRTNAVQSGSFKRHFLLLETGNEIANNCRSHYIDHATFEGIPQSLHPYCNMQRKIDNKYCTIYLLDGTVVKQRVY